MHISVYTEAFDICIHRIEYLNKYKKKKVWEKQWEYTTATEAKMNFIKQQKTEKARALCITKKSSRSAPFSHFSFFTSVATIPIQVTEWPATNKSNQVIPQSNKKIKDLHTLQQPSLKLPRFTPVIGHDFGQGLTSQVSNEVLSSNQTKRCVGALHSTLLEGGGWSPVAAASNELWTGAPRLYKC